MTVRLLFLCTGNTCRSPMAEALARRAARERGIGDRLRISSAGVLAASGLPASGGARSAAAEVDLDLEGHLSTSLAEASPEEADLVLGMTEGHRRAAAELCEPERAYLLTEFLPPDHPRHGGSVSDPVGGTLEEYRRTRELLRECVEGLLDVLKERSLGDVGPEAASASGRDGDGE